MISMKFRAIKLALIVTLPLAVLVFGYRATASQVCSTSTNQPGLFSPSNAKTEDGSLIPVAQFFSASRCQKCHQDTHAAWSQSLHRNAAREPFYRESADILLRTKGIEFTRHCESCHTPVALFSGALDKSARQQQAPFTSLDNEGVTCTVCHSITEARLDGTGSFTIRRPALLAQADGTPRYGDFTDEQILADVPAHKRAVMRPLLKQAEFCATCHKVDAPPALNGYKNIRGFSAYDEWQPSGASYQSVLPFYRREQKADCRACHMPKVESLNDQAAKSLEFRVSSFGNSLSKPETRDSKPSSLETQNPKLTLKARVNYRRLNQEYTSYVLKRQAKIMTVPIVKMAEAVVRVQWSVVGNTGVVSDRRAGIGIDEKGK